ncbi:MAG: hypothetical protein ACP5UN_02465 [Candidatus Micrarchaeia archaeon]
MSNLGYKKIKNIEKLMLILFLVLGSSSVYASSNTINTSNNLLNSNIIQNSNTIVASASSNRLPNTESFYSFIRSYIPNSIIEYSPLINITLNKNNYTIMWINGSGTSFIVFNTTNNNYSFLLNKSTIKTVLASYLTNKYYPSNATLKNLTLLMEEYRNQAQPPLSDCLVETGIKNYQCSASLGLINCLQNTCQTVPNCGGNPKYSVLAKFGSSSPFAYGILNFSIEYGELNSSYKKYFELANTINPSNFSQNIYAINNTLENISSLSSKIPDNPVFPTPTNINPASLNAQCSQYSFNNGPWYCYAVGLCEYTSFNSTLLGNIELLVSQLMNSPAYSIKLASISNASASLAYSYYEPVEASRAKAQLSSMLNASNASYNNALTKLEFLNSHYSNAIISSALFNLTSTYNTILAKSINQNIIQANELLNAEVANALAIYSKYGTPYISLYNSAQNASALIAIQELNYQYVPSSIAELAILQAALNARLNTVLNASSISSLQSSESAIYSNAKSINAPFSFSEFVKKATLINMLLPLINAEIPTKIAIAPYLAFIAPLILGILIIIAIYYLTYYRLSKLNKIKKSTSVKKAWIILFSILFIIVLISAGICVFYAESANSFLPISSFLSNINSSKNVYIIANSTINSSYYSCISALKSTLLNMGKNVIIVNATGYNCTLNSLKGSNCYNYLLNSGAPLIVISNGNSSIIHKGLYGSVLYASGSAAEGSSCILNNIVKVN